MRAHLEVERYLSNAVGVLSDSDALDLALLQRVIPKIRGYKRDLDLGLERLRTVLGERGCRRCGAVLDDWADAQTGDDAFLDGTAVEIGLRGQ